MRSLFLVAAFLCQLLFVPGCAKSSRKPVHHVRSQILLEGKPVPQAIVTFHPIDAEPGREPSPSAQTDAQGYFTLTSYASGDGAPEGEYAVTVTWFRSYATSPSGDDSTTANFLPSRYANPATSPLKATIRAGDNELPPLHVLPR